MKRETCRASAQFLNGLAVAILAAGVIGPAASGRVSLLVICLSILAGMVLHAAALLIAERGAR